MSLRSSTLFCFDFIQQPSSPPPRPTKNGVEPKKQTTDFPTIIPNNIIVLYPWGGTHFFITRGQMLKNSPLHIMLDQMNHLFVKVKSIYV